MRRTGIATIASLAILGIALGAFFGIRALVSSEEDPLEKAKEATTLDNAKPRFTGQMGDFVVGQPSAYPPCTFSSEQAYDINVVMRSELYSPALGDNAQAAACADGTIVSISPDHRVGRRYFVGPPSVPYEASLERLKLLTVGGKPAIAELPIPGNFVSYARLTVIERFPSEQKPGILTWADIINDLDGAIKQAEQIMGVSQ